MECPVKRAKRQRRYRQSPKGRATQAAAKRLYRLTANGAARLAEAKRRHRAAPGRMA